MFVFYINYLIKDNGNVISLCEIRNKNNICVNFLRLSRFVSAIPHDCKNIMLENPVGKLNNVVNKYTLISCTSQKVVKHFYSLFLQKVL